MENFNTHTLMEINQLGFVHGDYDPPFYTQLCTIAYEPYPNTLQSQYSFSKPPIDDIFQIHHLRFPTPPNTPPKVSSTTYIGDFPQKRTKSVIMKISPDNGLQHVFTTFVESKMKNHDAPNSESPSSLVGEYACDWMDCTRRYFLSLESLAVHVAQVHAVASIPDGLYYCRWIGCPRTERGFNARYKMLVHVRTHTKEKPHQCNLCQKSFSRAENLKIHIRSHSGEKPYVCTYEGCTKKYSNSSDRFKHTRTHSMEKPYMCKVPGCQKRYTDPSSLRKHVKTFRHAIQLLENITIPNTLRNYPMEQPSYYQDPIQNTQYYMNLSSEDGCHIKATEIECYYNEHQVNRDDCRICDSNDNLKSSLCQNSCAIHDSDFTIDIDMETPLDLRVKRS